MKGRKMLSNSEVAVFCEQSGMILESGLSMLEGISVMAVSYTHLTLPTILLV